MLLTFDGFDQQYVVALDKHAGHIVWRTDRNIAYSGDDGDIKKAYGTPTLFEFAGRTQLFSPSAGASIAYDPQPARNCGRRRSGGMNAAARPLFGHGLLFATSAVGGWQLFRGAARRLGGRERYARGLEICQECAHAVVAGAG